MKSICFICPYFGKLPREHMPVFLKSCKYNPTIDWIIYTDDRREYDYPVNVIVKYISFDDFRKKLQEAFDFKISLEYPYKICDYRPTFGYALKDEIKQYNYWGYCDMSDSIMGNLRSLFTEELLDSEYDKFLRAGHMSLYRNTNEVNMRIFEGDFSGYGLYDIIGAGGVGASDSMTFDEFAAYGINAIYKHYGYPIYKNNEMVGDVWPEKYPLYRSEDIMRNRKVRPMIFRWERGGLFSYSASDKGRLSCNEMAYVHLQRRKIHNRISDIGSMESFLITPRGYLDDVENITPKLIEQESKNKLFYDVYFKQKWKNLCYKLTHYRKSYYKARMNVGDIAFK